MADQDTAMFVSKTELRSRTIKMKYWPVSPANCKLFKLKPWPNQSQCHKVTRNKKAVFIKQQFIAYKLDKQNLMTVTWVICHHHLFCIICCYSCVQCLQLWWKWIHWSLFMFGPVPEPEMIHCSCPSLFTHLFSLWFSAAPLRECQVSMTTDSKKVFYLFFLFYYFNDKESFPRLLCGAVMVTG